MRWPSWRTTGPLRCKAGSGQPLPPAEGDARSSGDAWAQWPFNVYARSYRNYVDWWQKAWSNVPGVAPENERTLNFVARNARRADLPGQLSCHQSRAARNDPRRSRPESGARIQPLARGHQPHVRRQGAERNRKIRRRPRCRCNARQGRDAQRPDRTDPVFADDRRGVCRADPDHPGVDHEVLHSRPVGEQFAGEIPGVARVTPCSWCRGRIRTPATAASGWTTT